ncbi:MAG: hypothetical protein ACRDHP_01990 [Ktedonobacterales bacterium]
MIFTTVRLERPEGVAQLHGIPVQIEQASPQDMERVDFAGARPTDSFWVYTVQGVPSIPFKRRDVLFDELNTDPDTGQPAKYRVAGVAETFDDHQEVLCERVVGG